MLFHLLNKLYERTTATSWKPGTIASASGPAPQRPKLERRSQHLEPAGQRQHITHTHPGQFSMETPGMRTKTWTTRLRTSASASASIDQSATHDLPVFEPGDKPEGTRQSVVSRSRRSARSSPFRLRSSCAVPMPGRCCLRRPGRHTWGGRSQSHAGWPARCRAPRSRPRRSCAYWPGSRRTAYSRAR